MEPLRGEVKGLARILRLRSWVRTSRRAPLFVCSFSFFLFPCVARRCGSSVGIDTARHAPACAAGPCGRTAALFCVAVRWGRLCAGCPAGRKCPEVDRAVSALRPLQRNWLAAWPAPVGWGNLEGGSRAQRSPTLPATLTDGSAPSARPFTGPLARAPSSATASDQRLVGLS